MDKELKEKEKTLEKLSIEDEVEEKRLSIAQKRHIEKQLKSEEGIGWKKVMGIIGKLKMDKEQAQTLFSQGHELRELSKPNFGKFKRGL